MSYRYLLTIYQVYYILIYPYTQLIALLCIRLMIIHAILCKYTCAWFLVLYKYKPVLYYCISSSRYYISIYCISIGCTLKFT